MKYLVRQYRPAYCSGFTNVVVKGVEYDDICKQSWFDDFKYAGFTKFVIEPYDGDELIISAHYSSGEHWIVGFALPENSTMMSNNNDLMRDNWRYKSIRKLADEVITI